jgi:glutathione S-transferase
MKYMNFYMTPGSCSTGIHILLEELGAIFEATIINLPAGEHLEPEYLAVNPKASIPALRRIDGTVLTEIPAIACWLARTHPRAKFWPTDADAEALVLEVMAFVTGTLHGRGFARIFVPQSFSPNRADHQEIRQSGHKIVESGFAILEATLSADTYVAGAISVADPVLFYVLFWADKCGIPLPPNLLAHYRRMLSRPAVQQVLREEGYKPELLGQATQDVSADLPAPSL